MKVERQSLPVATHFGQNDDTLTQRLRQACTHAADELEQKPEPLSDAELRDLVRFQYQANALTSTHQVTPPLSEQRGMSKSSLELIARFIRHWASPKSPPNAG